MLLDSGVEGDFNYGAWLRRFHRRRILVCDLDLGYFGEKCCCFLSLPKISA